MALAATASCRTVDPGFSINSLNAHFLSGPNPAEPLRLSVQRSSDGGRFVTRTVFVEQNGKTMVHAFCSFVRSSALGGPSMVHSVSRQSNQTIENITLDDLELGKNNFGPVMKFQRLPLTRLDSASKSNERRPQSMVYTSVATISTPISSSSAELHALGIIALSDYHVLDAPPTLHGLTFGLPLINDTARKRTDPKFKLYTSLNHAIHFHVHDGFRADDLCYIEVTSPWANERRAEVHSRIFDRSGKLIATCVQEAYYVLKDGMTASHL